MIRVSRKTVDNVWPPHADIIQVAWNWAWAYVGLKLQYEINTILRSIFLHCFIIPNTVPNTIFGLTVFFCRSFMFFCLVFVMPLCASVYLCLVVTCWKRADLLALVCGG